MKAWLTGHGRVPWDEARLLIDGSMCAWAGLDGWQVATAPQQAPIATHLWAWSDGRWARLRLDRGDAVVAVLSAAEPAAGSGSGVTEEVEVRVVEAVPWSPTDGRLPKASRSVVGDPVTLLEVIGASPVTFVALGTST